MRRIWFAMFLVTACHAPDDAVDSWDVATLVPVACAKAMGPFRDAGTRVLQGNGDVYVPYGVTVPGLAHADYQDYAAADAEMIDATAGPWCGNTVRLQIAQDLLVGADGTTVSSTFMAAIATEVTQAESLGLVVVVNAQTQDVGHEPGPTATTIAFWRQIIAQYGNDPQVVFDLFNEPKVGTGNIANDWKLWQSGGTARGTTYLGMQDLVDDIRSNGAGNLVWIEGPYTAGTLAQVSSYPITGGPLSYAIHHPTGAHDTTVWWQDFGYLVAGDIAPVVVGEWTNYASTKSECWADAPTAVPEFLDYLEHHEIGMTTWTLRDGVLLQSANMTDPTHIKTDWRCADGLDEGAGHQLMNWFIRQNGGG